MDGDEDSGRTRAVGLWQRFRKGQIRIREALCLVGLVQFRRIEQIRIHKSLDFWAAILYIVYIQEKGSHAPRQNVGPRTQTALAPRPTRW